MEHPEDHSISGIGMINQGVMSEKFRLPGIPNISEEIIIARDLLVQSRVNSNLHLTHVSTSGSGEMIEIAKSRGVKVTADVTPHHLLLNEDMYDAPDSIIKVKPPVRSERDRQAMISRIIDGTIDCIATDHAPHALWEKQKEFADAPFGLIGMETAFPLIFDRFVRREIIDIRKLVELFSLNPARILNLNDRGSLDRGKAADITIIDPNKTFKIRKEEFLSKSQNSPFIGWKGKGSIVYTIVDGEIVFQEKR
jgi:dihydroorotase